VSAPTLLRPPRSPRPTDERLGSAGPGRGAGHATIAGHRRAARAAQRSFGRTERRIRRKVHRSILWRWRRPLYLLGLLFLAGVSGALAVLSRLQPPPEQPLVQTSWICTAEVDPTVTPCGPDNAIAALAAEEDRQLVTFDEIPPVLVDAVIAAEDRDFFSHTGVDPAGIARALWVDLRNQGSQGGSTITQQYVKNAYLTPERTLVRKLREAVLAIKIERRFTKQEILERYLNRIYFGRGAYGVQAASKAYFGKNVGDVNLAEAAYLAGLIRSPETADARIDPAEADFRRQSVLDAMVEEGMVVRGDAGAAARVPIDALVIDRRDRSVLDVKLANCGMDYVVDWVRQQLLEEHGPAIYTDGLRVYLSIDGPTQCLAYGTLYNDLLSDPAADPDASLVALDRDRRVVALVGGRDHRVSQVNLALGVAGGGSGRQAGSAFKPIVLAEAIRQGISPLSRYPAPAEVVIVGADDGKDWTVKGGASPAGASTLAAATAQSSNTVYAQLITEVGPENVAALANAMGVTADLAANPALVLGAAEVSVLDMASVYATLANGGEFRPPRVIDRIERADGSEIVRPDAGGDAPLTATQAGQVTGVLEQVIDSGTGTRAAISWPAAGKTGTTDDYRDAWFAGYSCDLTAVVWMGYAGRDGQAVQAMLDVRGEREVGGGTLPADLWARFMGGRGLGEPPDRSCLGATRDYSGLEIRNPNLSLTAPSTPAPGSPIPGGSSTTVPGAASTTVAGTPATTPPGPSPGGTSPSPAPSDPPAGPTTVAPPSPSPSPPATAPPTTAPPASGPVPPVPPPTAAAPPASAAAPASPNQSPSTGAAAVAARAE
jgi:penicillin-binding protein 1A